MTHKIKALGLAFVAVAAMSMAAASAAQASELHATTQTGKATITGEQTTHFVLTTKAGTTTCEEVKFEGTIQGTAGQPQITAQELTLTPTYGKCKFAGLNSTVQMNGCKYTITNKSGAQIPVTTAKTAYLDITGCTAGKQIVGSAAGGACVKTIPEQHHLSHLVFKDEGPTGSQEDVLVEVTISGITYELHGAFCGAGVKVTELTHDGTLHGKATFKAFVDTKTEQVTEHGHQFLKSFDDGVQQVGLRST